MNNTQVFIVNKFGHRVWTMFYNTNEEAMDVFLRLNQVAQVTYIVNVWLTKEVVK